jgi:hypothetical protein
VYACDGGLNGAKEVQEGECREGEERAKTKDGLMLRLLIIEEHMAHV